MISALLRRIGGLFGYGLPDMISADPEERWAHALLMFRTAQSEMEGGNIRRAVRYMDRYRQLADYERLRQDDRRDTAVPELSVIIVSCGRPQALAECLAALAGQRDTPAVETIVVDNGLPEGPATETVKGKALLHIVCPFNMGASEGRNIGAHFARGTGVCFIDDDAVPAPDYLYQAAQAFRRQPPLAGFRGRVLPRTPGAGTGHYDLGDRERPADINLEGNCGFPARLYRETGGMDPLLFGHEGTDLSFRLWKDGYGDVLRYLPGLVVRHDYRKYTGPAAAGKAARHRVMERYLRRKHAGIKAYRRQMKAAVPETP